jgi:hypothetical protein
MTERHEFNINGQPVKVIVGGHINDELLDQPALAELADALNAAAAWTQKHQRSLRIQKIPAVASYEPPPAMPGETWRSIPGFEDSHEASSAGRIRSIDRIVPMADPWHPYGSGIKVEKTVRGRILVIRLRGHTPYVTLTAGGRQRAYKVKNLIEAAFPDA